MTAAASLWMLWVASNLIAMIADFGSPGVDMTYPPLTVR